MAIVEMTIKSSFCGVLRTLASPRLAVVVLGTLAGVLAMATIIESRFGSSTAWRYIYGVAWFTLLLGVLGLNVAAATISRWPWKPRHIGFVVTHAGILAVLGGSLATNWFGVTGRLALQQGTQDDRIVLDDWVVAARAGMSQTSVQVAIGQPPQVGRVRSFEMDGQPYQLRVLQYLPDAEPQAQVVEGTQDDPPTVLMVELIRGPWQQRTWLTWAEPASVGDGADKVELTLQAREVALPFAVRLDRFEVEEYPGTSEPSMFRSTVTVIDQQQAQRRTVDIEMNKPLEYRGWSFFQSSYSIDGNQRVSVLAVSKDPGKPIVLAGAMLLVIGTALLALQRLMPTRPGAVGGKVMHGDTTLVEIDHA